MRTSGVDTAGLIPVINRTFAENMVTPGFVAEVGGGGGTYAAIDSLQLGDSRGCPYFVSPET